MNKQNVISFFDRLAPQWDATTIRNDAIIDAILGHAAVGPHADVLDVACGTGVLFPDYLRRGVGSDMICVGGAMLIYELCVFAAGVTLELTYPGRWPVFVMTALVSALTAGVFYRPLKHIGTIGGNQWKE